MKPSGPLARKTPLKAKTGVRRTSTLSASPLARTPRRASGARQVHQPKRRTPSGIPAKVRAALARRSDGICEVQAPGCAGRAVDPSHRKKTGNGGRHGEAAVRHQVLSNLLHACRGCHEGAIHAMPAAAYWRGWMLRENENPREVACLYRGVWVLLDDQGAIFPTQPKEASR
jgi:hypothetical protein